MGHHLVDFGGAMVLPSNLATCPKAAFRKTQHQFHLFTSAAHSHLGVTKNGVISPKFQENISGTCGTFPCSIKSIKSRYKPLGKYERKNAASSRASAQSSTVIV
jgi:hypothetical protein